MPRNHLRPKLEGHRPHAKGGLGDHHQQDKQWQLERLIGQVPLPPGPGRQQHDQQAQGAGEITVGHLAPAFVSFHRGIGKMQLGMGQLRLGLGHADKPVAAGPVRAAEAGVGQAGIGAEQHHHQRQQGGKQGKTKSGFGHDIALYPILDSFSSRRRSLSTSLPITPGP